MHFQKPTTRLQRQSITTLARRLSIARLMQRTAYGRLMVIGYEWSLMKSVAMKPGLMVVKLMFQPIAFESCLNDSM